MRTSNTSPNTQNYQKKIKESNSSHSGIMRGRPTTWEWGCELSHSITLLFGGL